MALSVNPLKPVSNAVLLDAIRADGSNDYQRRIPAATKASVQATMKALQSNRPLYNEFLDALVNRIGLVIARNNAWTNPLAQFKRGTLEWGDTIEEIQVGLLKAKVYDHDRDSLEKDIFGTERPEVQSSFHRVNRESMYKITINESELRRAFLEQGGLTSFVSQLMEAPRTSDNWDEFLLMCQLFPEYESNGGFYKINVPDVVNSPDSATAADNAKTALRKMRALAGNLGFISDRYNAAKMPVSAQKDDLVIFTTPEYNAAVDVEALAAAFNPGKADMTGRVIEIPQEQLGIDGAQAILTTKDFFVMADQKFETTSIFNPASLHNNYFLHHWQVISASRFVPAVLFWDKAGDDYVTMITPVTSVSAITIVDGDGATATELERGFIYALDATANTNPAGGVNDGVRWSVSGQSDPRTYITQEGVLHVGGLEGAANLTVTATATWTDPSGLMKDGATSTITLPVTGNPLPVWPIAGSVWETVTDITVKGVEVSPTFNATTTAYTVTVPGGTAAASDVVVSGPPAGDVDITVSADGKTITVSSPASPNDPVYTVTVS